MLFLLFYNQFFWLASLASIMHRVDIWKILITFKLNENIMVITSLNSLFKYHKKLTSHSWRFWKGISMFIVSRITILHHLNLKFSGGRPPDPTHTHFTLSKNINSYVFVPPPEKARRRHINYVNYCMKNCFKGNQISIILAQVPRLPSFPCHFFKVGPPLQKFLDQYLPSN